MLNKVKLALRISHNKLDNDITDTIAQARAEMVRAGVSQSKAAGSDDCVAAAIKVYAKMVYATDEKLRSGYEKSWLYQLDNLRKSYTQE